MLKKAMMVLGSFMLAESAWAQSQLKMQEIPPAVTLAGEEGELVKNGAPWDSTTLKNKVTMLVYVDPDEGDLNDKLTERLQAEKFDLDKFGSVAVINMAATWKPNMVINSVLRGKQEKYSNTLYVKDMKKKLVNAWGLKDDSYHVLLFNKSGALIHDKFGKFSDADIEAFVKLVKESI